MITKSLKCSDMQEIYKWVDIYSGIMMGWLVRLVMGPPWSPMAWGPQGRKKVI